MARADLQLRKRYSLLDLKLYQEELITTGKPNIPGHLREPYDAVWQYNIKMLKLSQGEYMYKYNGSVRNLTETRRTLSAYKLPKN